MKPQDVEKNSDFYLLCPSLWMEAASLGACLCVGTSKNRNGGGISWIQWNRSYLKYLGGKNTFRSETQNRINWIGPGMNSKSVNEMVWGIKKK